MRGHHHHRREGLLVLGLSCLVGLAAGAAPESRNENTWPLPRTTTDDVALSSAIDSLAQAALEDGPIAGLSIAVLREGDLVVSQGYGYADVENAVPATDATVYNLASVSKLLTATAVMKLVDSGSLKLDDDLSTVLPEFPNREQGRRITIRHLLSHTSGLCDYEDADTQRWLSEGTPLTPAFVFEFARDRPLDFEPGSRFSYSNTGFYLLGLILERVTGREYGAYVRRDIALPLGLNDTFLCDEALLPERSTRGYELDDDSLVASRLYKAPGILGDGGLCSTVRDLVRIPAALRSGAVVSEAAFAQMVSPTTITPYIVVDYGLGVRLGTLDGHRLLGHTGGMSTYWAVLADYPDDGVTIAVLVNTDGAAEDALTVEGSVARAVLGLGRPMLQDLVPAVARLRVLGGLYEDGTSRVRLYEEGGRLLRATENGERPPRPLLYQGDATFGRSDYPMDRIVFHVHDDHALGLSEYYNGFFATFRRAVAP